MADQGQDIVNIVDWLDSAADEADGLAVFHGEVGGPDDEAEISYSTKARRLREAVAEIRRLRALTENAKG